MGDVTRLSALAMADLVRQREVSPVELVKAHLSRIENLHSKLKAFVQLDSQRALRDARTAERAVEHGPGLGPLNGVPISIKSSIDVAGLRCEAGTKLRKGYVANHDAPLVSRLRAAGAIVLGVTNCPELLMAWETDNLIYGRTNNPWDLSRTPGGSSGGGAAAIVACRFGRWGGGGRGGGIPVSGRFSGSSGLGPPSAWSVR